MWGRSPYGKHQDVAIAERYWVVGGIYTDSRFRNLARGGAEERIGPFRKYDDALDVWRGKAWATVDDSFARYRIVEG